MPVLLLKDRCVHLAHCYAATVCPNGALFYAKDKGQVVVAPDRCGGCRGPCLNFCDHYALRYAPSLEELRLLQAELDGTISAEEIAQERLQMKQRAEDERKKQLVAEVTSTTFQKQVLEASLPVLLEVWSQRIEPDDSLLPLLQQLAQRYMGEILVRRVNADKEPQLVNALQIRSVPTLIMFHRGQFLDGVMGRLSAGQLQSWVQGLLGQIQMIEEDSGAIPDAPGLFGGPLG